MQHAVIAIEMCAFVISTLLALSSVFPASGTHCFERQYLLA